MPHDSLLTAVDRTFAGMKEAREEFVPALSAHETGTITTVSTGIATVVGLPGVGFEELIQFPGDLYGIAFNLDEK
jgi:F-type H+-transporting ATPase subunit alpha